MCQRSRACARLTRPTIRSFICQGKFKGSGLWSHTSIVHLYSLSELGIIGQDLLNPEEIIAILQSLGS